MRWVWLLALVEAGLRTGDCVNPDQDQDGEVEGRNFMDYLNRETSMWVNRISLAEWDYESNLTDFNLQRKVRGTALWSRCGLNILEVLGSKLLSKPKT